VLDPFAGSGTSLVQANELGIHAIGCDISAFNVMLCRAKTAHYDLERLKHEIDDVLNKTRKATQTTLSELPLFQSLELPVYDISTDSEYLRRWFAPRALFELITYRDIVRDGRYTYPDILNVILSRAARSARLTTHFDLDFPKQPQTEPYWCYKHSRICEPTSQALKFLTRYSHDTMRRIAEFSVVRTNAVVTVHHVDSRVGVDLHIDGVITSPPYVGLIDYHEQHMYAYQLLKLQDKRVAEIGPAVGGAGKRAQRQYQEDIAAVFQNALTHMPSGGRLIVIAGDRANLYDEIARMVGVEVENILQRHVNRRTGRRSGEFFESVFIWRKPA